MRKLGNQLRPKLPLPAQLTHGTVVAVDTGTDTISVDLGDTANPTTSVPVLPGYYPTVGDYILLHRMGPYLVAAGTAAPVTSPASARVLGYSEVTTQQTEAGGGAAVIATSVTVMIPAGHKVRITASIYGISAGATGDQHEVRIRRSNGTILQSTKHTIQTASKILDGHSFFWYDAAASLSGSQTFELELARVVGATALATLEAAGAGRSNTLLVEDTSV
jgi:hypothetical protein